jgi:hypothetical protein
MNYVKTCKFFHTGKGRENKKPPGNPEGIIGILSENFNPPGFSPYRETPAIEAELHA